MHIHSLDESGISLTVQGWVRGVEYFVLRGVQGNGWDYNLMFRGLFLILGLLAVVWASEAELDLQGSLKIKENTYDRKT